MDDAQRRDWDRLFADRIRNAEAQAPALAEALLQKYRTPKRAAHAARWKYGGSYLAQCIVDYLERPPDPRTGADPIPSCEHRSRRA